jgi:hypothetical protein
LPREDGVAAPQLGDPVIPRPWIHVGEQVLMDGANVDIVYADRALGQHPMPAHHAARSGNEFEVGQHGLCVDAEVVAQHRRSRYQVGPVTTEDLPVVAWRRRRRRRVAGPIDRQVFAERHLVAEQPDEGVDVIVGRSAAFESFGGDGLVDGVPARVRQPVTGGHGSSAERRFPSGWTRR